MESFGTVAGEAITLEKSSDRLISKELEMDLLASNQLLSPKPLEPVESMEPIVEEAVPNEFKGIYLMSPEPKPHTPPSLRPSTIVTAVTGLKRPTRFLDSSNPPPRPPSPEIGKYASVKISSRSQGPIEEDKPKSSLDRNLEEIREDVLMDLIGGEERA
jgi:hypothetical protein